MAALSIATAAHVSMADQTDPILDELFVRLATAQHPSEAAVLEAEIWQRWIASGRADIDAKMAAGVNAMESGDGAAALAAFDAIVEEAPNFAEGWNKRATLYYLMGDLDASARDVDRTLALEPRHFGALSGLAMIRASQGRPFEALEALEKLVVIHPRLPHLQERIDHLTRQLGEPI